MPTKYATDALFIEASKLGETSALELETALPIDDPCPVEEMPIQTEEGKTPVAPEPRPWFRRYVLFSGNPGNPGSAGAPVEIETEKPYWRLVTVTAPILPAGLEFSYDRLFRDPDVATIATNLVRIPIGPGQSLFARVPQGVLGNLFLSILVDPWVGRR